MKAIYLIIEVIFNLILFILFFYQLYKKINGHELSWALGAAFNIIQNGF